jgi:hypothetical protein
MIKVYQIALTDAEIDAINRGEQTEKTKASVRSRSAITGLCKIISLFRLL